MTAGPGARRTAALLGFVSAGLLAGALGFQFLGGLPPCEMCHWQRWAHLGVLALAVPAALSGQRALALAATLAMLVSAGLGLWHAGVEQRWWAGVTACAAAPAAGASLLEQLSQPLVRCDQIPWSLMGLSMAGWNAAISAAAALCAILLLWRGSLGRRV